MDVNHDWESDSLLMRRYFSWLKHPEWVFVITASLFGGLLCFLIPNQAGFDEPTHLARVWEISGGYLLPNQLLSQGPHFPAAFANISYRNQYFYDPVVQNYFTVYGSERINWDSFVNYETQSSYLPIPYLPQAFEVGLLARLWDAPVLVIFYGCRLLYLLGYILLTFFAIRIIPFGKWILVALSLAPMALFQASTISPDAYTNGASFLFIGWVLGLAFQEKPVNWKQLWITVIITAVLISMKINAAFLLPVLMVLIWKRFESRKMLPILAGSVAVLFIVLVAGWNLLAYSTFFLNKQGYGVSGQLAYILSNPSTFSKVFSNDLSNHGIMYLQEWVAVYGYGAGKVPIVTYPLFGLVLMAAWLSSPAEPPLKLRIRIIMILSGIIGCILMILVNYLTMNPIGANSIYNVQGRHFIPIVPVLLLGLVPGRKLFSRFAKWIFPLIVGVGAVLTLAVYVLGVYLSYYVICGTSLYTPGLCYQPLYKNWESDSQLTQPVTKDVVLQQSFVAVCKPLRSVRVWSASPSQNAVGETQITLKDAQSGMVVVEKLVNNQTVADYAWLEVPFAPINDVTGKQYGMEITSGFSDPNAGIAFGVTARREYQYGMIINSKPADFDLIFQYGCEPLRLVDLIGKRKP